MLNMNTRHISGAINTVKTKNNCFEALSTNLEVHQLIFKGW